MFTETWHFTLLVVVDGLVFVYYDKSIQIPNFFSFIVFIAFQKSDAMLYAPSVNEVEVSAY